MPTTTDNEAHFRHSTPSVETTERNNGIINKDYIRKPVVIFKFRKMSFNACTLMLLVV